MDDETVHALEALLGATHADYDTQAALALLTHLVRKAGGKVVVTEAEMRATADAMGGAAALIVARSMDGGTWVAKVIDVSAMAAQLDDPDLKGPMDSKRRRRPFDASRN